ncbi:MAG: hypothetical protein F6J98_28815 [Moorea sp. SIO4G2]|nr:hypothetical protein [Moorena sp. SIO4G2]
MILIALWNGHLACSHSDGGMGILPVPTLMVEWASCPFPLLSLSGRRISG